MLLMNQTSTWKSRAKAVVRWSLLADAIVATLAALLTAFKSPAWLDWAVGMIVPECALWFALLTLGFAGGAWLLRSGHPVITGATLGFCLIAFCLFMKPAVQAWQLGRALPAQLGAAFGPAAPERPPFSISSAVFGGSPQSVPIETMEYSKTLLLDFYRAVGRSPAPCVIVIHGGSWVSGNRYDFGTKRWLNDWLAQRGYAVASIDYRLCPEYIWPAQRDDLLAAIEYLRANATKLGIDPNQFVLLGRSAGGQMAPSTAYWKYDPSIRGVIAIYPPTDFYATWESATHPGNLDHRLNLEWFLGGTPDTAHAAYDSASAALLAGPSAPPTLIIQGKLDINVFHQQAELLAEKLAAAKVPHALVSLPWAAHAFDLISFNSPGSQIETYAVDWFLKTVTH
jgi:acetyl esterase/lipase